CEVRPSIHSGEPAPNTLVMSPVGSCAYTVTALALACAFASGEARFTVAPEMVVIVATSAAVVPFPRMIVRPGARLAADATVMLVAPAEEAAARVVLPLERVAIAVLFSSTALAVPTLPTSQPARVNGTQGAGALRLTPVPPSDAGSLLTMLKFESADG